MKIAIVGSMVFTDNMLKIKKELEKLGYKVLVSGFAHVLHKNLFTEPYS